MNFAFLQVLAVTLLGSGSSGVKQNPSPVFHGLCMDHVVDTHGGFEPPWQVAMDIRRDNPRADSVHGHLVRWHNRGQVLHQGVDHQLAVLIAPRTTVLGFVIEVTQDTLVCSRRIRL